jgi:nitroreductase
MTYDAFHGLVETRRSIRQYAAEEVAEADVGRILAAVRLCPTAGNLQAYQVVVVRDAERRAALAAAAGGQPWVEEAPIVLAFVALPAVSAARYDERGSELYAVQDATIAATYAMLAATSLGWGTVWVGAFDTAAAARALDCAEGELPVALLPVGRAAESPPARPRRAVEELSRRL